MTREEKKAVTALGRAMPRLTRTLVKPYRYKSIDGIVWTAQNGMLFILSLFVSTLRGEDRVYVRASCEAKPLLADDLLWDILGFEENKSKPMSLRVNGAFALYGIPVYEHHCELTTLDEEHVSQLVQAELEEFSAFLTSLTGREMAWFRELEKKQERYAYMEVMRPLLMLHDGKPDEALAYVTTHDVSCYIVNGKTVGQLIETYCLDRA